MNVKLIGITGGSGSGKSTVVRKIYEAHPDAVCIEQDNYYKSASYINNDNITAYNFDHPDAFDMDLMMQNLMDLKNGKAIEMPQYDFVHHQRKDETVQPVFAQRLCCRQRVICAYKTKWSYEPFRVVIEMSCSH